jgi:hypothetical protein
MDLGVRLAAESMFIVFFASDTARRVFPVPRGPRRMMMHPVRNIPDTLR